MFECFVCVDFRLKCFKQTLLKLYKTLSFCIGNKLYLLNCKHEFNALFTKKNLAEINFETVKMITLFKAY